MPRLYEEVLAIARNYMGAAAEDYIRRRIRIVQGGRDPQTLEPDRLDRLAAGIEMTATGYMSEPKAAAFRDAVLELRKKFVSSRSRAESDAEEGHEEAAPAQAVPATKDGEEDTGPLLGMRSRRT